eukprot:scaffold174429_cov36-Cyclotella_meneghiniana.AAC.1
MSIARKPIAQRKKACKQRARGKLCANPPTPRENCPIYCLTLPPETQRRCPFCNAPAASSAEEWNGRLLEKIDKDNDPDVVNLLGNGFSIDTTKAAELYCSASEP